jgi:hypothetical protein
LQAEIEIHFYSEMVVVAQLVRVSVCGSEGRGFESRLPPKVKGLVQTRPFFIPENSNEVQFDE